MQRISTESHIRGTKVVGFCTPPRRAAPPPPPSEYTPNQHSLLSFSPFVFTFSFRPSFCFFLVQTFLCGNSRSDQCRVKKKSRKKKKKKGIGKGALKQKGGTARPSHPGEETYWGYWEQAQRTS